MPPAASVPTREIVGYLDELLDADGFDDYGPNGLQVPGAQRVGKVATGVSAQLELFERAADAGAQLVLAHHGILWDFQERRITPALAARLRVLFDRDIALAAYHLPLDAHREHGNNALIARGLGATPLPQPFALHHGRSIGVAAEFPEGVARDELVERVRRLTAREPLVVSGSARSVRTIGIVSGAAAGNLAAAIELGLDAFLTGEPAEHVMADARENGVEFIAAGHYATETFGVRALGELVAERFGVEHEFIDIPNPI